MTEFNVLVDKALYDCPTFMDIDFEFMGIPSGIYDARDQIDYFNNLKQKALKHFETCDKKYCKLICEHNKMKTNVNNTISVGNFKNG